ncbi:MAG: hypothetical protein JST60_21695 [Chloroflexi bacterium SZAS-1]|jgi:3-hydroxyisobutyrate dehydrogenase-like beta-hydroxyacid dehydrogenase|nr:hypothetical protein [Chloroflexi bacterium SZAS-1]
MGDLLASNLAQAGGELTVFDLDVAKMERVVAIGAKPASSGQAVAAAAAVLFTF